MHRVNIIVLLLSVGFKFCFLKYFTLENEAMMFM